MKIPTKPQVKIDHYPLNWPHDGLSKVLDRDDVTILTHPHRAPHKWDPVARKWGLL